MQVIETQWTAFAEVILKPAGVSPDGVQYKELKRAFYAGAAAVFFRMLEVSDSEEATDADLKIPQGISDELTAWIAELRAGRV